MRLKGLVWVGSIATIFFFLPSMAFKIWDFIIRAPWPQKSWFLYFFSGILIVQIARVRRRKRKLLAEQDSPDSLLFIAKQRLVKGELSIEEFRRIREELKQL